MNFAKIFLVSNVSNYIVKIYGENNALIFAKTVRGYDFNACFYTCNNYITIKVFPLRKSVYPSVKSKLLNLCGGVNSPIKLIFTDNRYKNKFFLFDSVYRLPVKKAILTFTSI